MCYKSNTMTDAHTTLRLSEKLLARADALVPILSDVPEIEAMGQVSRSAVLRLALAKGIAQLEEEHPPGRSRRRR